MRPARHGARTVQAGGMRQLRQALWLQVINYMKLENALESNQEAEIHTAPAQVDLVAEEHARAHGRGQRPGVGRRDLDRLRAQDEAHLEELLAAGATEVVPETLEAALTLVANTLHMLQVPTLRVMRTSGGT